MYNVIALALDPIFWMVLVGGFLFVGWYER